MIQSRLAYSADKQNGGDFGYGYLAAVTSDQTLFYNTMSSITARVIMDKYAPGMGSYYAQSDINHYAGSLSLNYDKHLNNSFLRTYNLNLNSNATFEREGNHQIRNIAHSGNCSLNFTPKFNLSFYGNIGSERMQINNKLIDWNEINADLSLNRWRLISGNVGINYCNIMLFNLLDPREAYPRYIISGGINGFLGPVVSYIFRNNHVIWQDLPQAGEYNSGVKGDAEYDITNLDMELTFSNDVKIVTGVRYNNYEIYGYSQHVGYFATLHYSIDAYTKLYAGFKSTEDEYLQTMQKTSETAWFKLSRTF